MSFSSPLGLGSLHSWAFPLSLGPNTEPRTHCGPGSPPWPPISQVATHPCHCSAHRLLFLLLRTGERPDISTMPTTGGLWEGFGMMWGEVGKQDIAPRGRFRFLPLLSGVYISSLPTQYSQGPHMTMPRADLLGLLEPFRSFQSPFQLPRTTRPLKQERRTQKPTWPQLWANSLSCPLTPVLWPRAVPPTLSWTRA